LEKKSKSLNYIYSCHQDKKQQSYKLTNSSKYTNHFSKFKGIGGSFIMTL